MYYVPDSMFSAADIKVNKTLVKAVAKPHSNRPLRDEVVGQWYGTYAIDTKMKDSQFSQE